jgi:hypothetical protein
MGRQPTAPWWLGPLEKGSRSLGEARHASQRSVLWESGQSEVADSPGVLEAAITADSKQITDQFLRSRSKVI